ncbi:2OG-Fe(II) oxygenase [Streptomyces sp. NPDC048717]|uniref:2OG-Fe(II) oxygenase n=1 Tax=Streptomyces sp. NPDC048717 TaxID=3154928 RepID=UPI003443426A
MKQTALHDDVTRGEILTRASVFIAPEYVREETLDTVSQWMKSSSPEPMVFRNFLRPEAAAVTAAALRALPVWSRHVTAYYSQTETEIIDEADWADHPQRAACHYVAQPLTAALADGAMAAQHQTSLRRFLKFAVLTNGLRDWVSLGTGVRLSPKECSVEFAAYGRGDQIRPHQDLFPRRVLGGNLYLDEEHRSDTGGRLGFRLEGGEETMVEPAFNTFSLFPIRPDAHHWVEPFQRDTTGRYTVSFGLHRAE